MSIIFFAEPKRLLFILALVFTAVSKANAATISDVSFYQVDWFDGNDVLHTKDSLWGRMDMKVSPHPTDYYYLNVVADSGNGSSWIIQNMPLFPSSTDSPANQSVDFNIWDLGLSAGQNLSMMDVFTNITLEPLDAAPSGAKSTTIVSTFERRSTCGTLGDLPNDVGEPSGHKAKGKITDLIPKKDKKIPSVQEDNKKCLAGAFARSIGWLDKEHNLGSGKTPQEIYNDLKQDGLGVKPYTKGLEIKAKYLKDIDPKAETKILDPKNTFPKVPGITEENGDLVQWLYKELPTEDVELDYTSHIVTVASIFRQGGKIFIKYHDDEKQNNPQLGDKFQKVGELRESNIDDIYFFKLDKKISNNSYKVRIGISESVKTTEPSGSSWLLILGTIGVFVVRLR